MQAQLEKAVLQVEIELQHQLSLGAKLKRAQARKQASCALNASRLQVRPQDAASAMRMRKLLHQPACVAARLS